MLRPNFEAPRSGSSDIKCIEQQMPSRKMFGHNWARQQLFERFGHHDQVKDLTDNSEAFERQI